MAQHDYMEINSRLLSYAKQTIEGNFDIKEIDEILKEYLNKLLEMVPMEEREAYHYLVQKKKERVDNQPVSFVYPLD